MRMILASLKTVFIDKPENVLIVLKVIAQVPTLKRIVLTKKLTDQQDSDIRNKAQSAGIEIIKFDQLRVRFLIEFLSQQKTIRVFRNSVDRNLQHIM